MTNIVNQLREYFKNTPKDQIDKYFEDLDYLNNVGPNLEDYIKSIKEDKNYGGNR